MLTLAGFTSDRLEILPTVINATSMDTVRDVAACPATTRMSRFATTLQIQLDYPAGCAVYFFGRDLGCMVQSYQSAGRFHSAAWAAFLEQSEKQGLYPSPLIHDVPIQAGRPLAVIVWHDRLSAPDVTAMHNEIAIPLNVPTTH
jgi:hypothetical protein